MGRVSAVLVRALRRAEEPGALGHSPVFYLILKNETRFWRIFLRLLIPAGFCSFVICATGTIISLTDDRMLFDDPADPGGWGPLICIAAFPVLTLVLAILLTPFAYHSQRVRSSLWREP